MCEVLGLHAVIIFSFVTRQAMAWQSLNVGNSPEGLDLSVQNNAFLVFINFMNQFTGFCYGYYVCLSVFQ